MTGLRVESSSYRYDDLDRLVAETVTGTTTSDVAYVYDAVGNRLVRTNNGVTVAYSYPYGYSDSE
jgi:YD repeat-containing protein